MTSTNLDEAIRYATERNWMVFPVHYVLKSGKCSCRAAACSRIGKHPATEHGKDDATRDPAQIKALWTSPHFNIGLATGHDGLVVMDVDVGPKKSGNITLKGIVERNAPLPVTLQCNTGGGGVHYYFLTTNVIPSSQGRVGSHIDVRAQGGYVILPPSNHVSSNRYAWQDFSVPIALLPDWLSVLMQQKPDPQQDVASQQEVADDLKQQRDKGHFSKQDLIKLLDIIPSDDRDDWFRVGCALKSEFGDEKGYELWDAWSAKSSKYDSRIQQQQWRTFNDTTITGGTIHFIAKEKYGFKGFDAAAADSPELKDNWIYVVGIKRFVEIQRAIELDKEQFDSQFAPLFRKGRGSDHVLRNAAFQRVYAATYWPSQPMRVTEAGVEKLNYWRPNPIQPEHGDISTFIDHINYLLPKPEEAAILINYLTFQVKYPGEKVHWSILLSGKQGTGKSYLATVMQSVLGQHNVHILNNEVLHEPFTGWQRNTQFIVVEEIMAGNRRETMNKLKPMITEPWCSIREMYKPPYEQPNRFNFLFLTNHTDAIIIDNTDRRYCVLASESEPRDNAYYAHLFDWTRRNAAALLHFMLNRPLENFQPKAHAPVTQGKIDLIRESLLPLDHFIYEHVQTQDWPFDVDLSNPNHLVELLPQFGLRGTAKDISKAYRKLGYLELGRLKVATNGDYNKIRLWAVRNPDQYTDLDNDQIRQLFSIQYSKQQQDHALNNRGSSAEEELRRHRPVNMVKVNEPMQ